MLAFRASIIWRDQSSSNTAIVPLRKGNNWTSQGLVDTGSKLTIILRNPPSETKIMHRDSLVKVGTLWMSGVQQVYFLDFMCMGVRWCIYTHVRAYTPLELELRMVVNLRVCALGTELGSPARTAVLLATELSFQLCISFFLVYKIIEDMLCYLCASFTV